MLKFEGPLSEETKRRILEKVRRQDQIMLLIGIVVAWVPVTIVAGTIGIHIPIAMYIASAVIAFLMPFIPKSAKEKAAIMPQSITISQECLVCVTEKAVIKRRYEDVKEVQDCKTYYEIVFRFGKLSPHFVCQKNLLSKGDIEEFNQLFGDKLEDLTDFF